VDVTLDDTRIVATDRAGRRVEVETVGWDQPAPKQPLPFAMEATITGRVTRLSVDANSIAVGTLDEDGKPQERRPINPNTELEWSTSGVDNSSFVATTAPLDTWIRFDDDVTIEKRGEKHVVLSFPRPTAVTLGFWSDLDAPAHEVTVPRTPAGVATGISYFRAAFTETSPRRTALATRGYPPRIRFGDEESIPEELATVADLDVQLTLPPTLEALIPAASLSAYLGARLRVAEDATPRLWVPSLGFTHEFDPMPAFQHQAASLLRRVAYLDLLVRWVTETDYDWLEADALTVLDLDPEACVERSMAERLVRYLSVDFERVSPIFPELASYVYAEPAYETVRTLPHLVANLTQVYLPGASPDRTDAPSERPDVRGVPGGDAATSRQTGPTPRTDGPYVGWLGDDPMADTYELHPRAYSNRERYFGDREAVTVALACTDPERSAALESIREWYHSETQSITVSELRSPTCGELADRLEAGVDFLHFVGPCRDGLACADGRLEPGELTDPSVRAFFLDGPDSYATGRAMIEAGSVAGAVWDGPVTAASEPVRRTFVRTLVGGFTVDLARRHALGYADDPAPLRVVGDGLHELVDYDQMQVYPMVIEPLGDRQFRVRISPIQTDVGIAFGGLCLDRWQFGGNEFDLTLDAADVTQLLETQQYVVHYEGDVYDAGDVTPFDPTI